jgi:hypothetical protein
MIKKDIKFDDFDGNPVVETHYFHLSKPELIKMDQEADGGMSGILQNLQKSNNAHEIYAMFTLIIKKAYGKRDANNATRFVKDEVESEQFIQSLAFDALLTEMLTDPMAAAVFVNGIVPKDLADTDEVKEAFKAAEKLQLPAAFVQASRVPDPNNLDKNGPWPGNRHEIALRPDPAAQAQADRDEEEDARRSGLSKPFDSDGNLVPWHNRKPTEKELMGMKQPQLLDVSRRSNSDWEPSVGG